MILHFVENFALFCIAAVCECRTKIEPGRRTRFSVIPRSIAVQTAEVSPWVGAVHWNVSRLVTIETNTIVPVHDCDSVYLCIPHAVVVRVYFSAIDEYSPKITVFVGAATVSMFANVNSATICSFEQLRLARDDGINYDSDFRCTFTVRWGYRWFTGRKILVFTCFLLPNVRLGAPIGSTITSIDTEILTYMDLVMRISHVGGRERVIVRTGILNLVKTWAFVGFIVFEFRAPFGLDGCFRPWLPNARNEWQILF